MIRAWVLVVFPFLLVGCAEQARLVRPQDFPLHASDDPFFNLHWRVDREDGAVMAVGLVEAARVDGIGEVTLELRGLDASGRVVSRSLGQTHYGGRLFRGDSWPFRVRLRPTGQEDRFDLRVWSYTWQGTRDHGGGGGR